MQNLGQGSHIPIQYQLRNCDKICLNPECGDTMRLIISKQQLNQKTQLKMMMNDYTGQKCLHPHEEYVVSIQDILDNKCTNMKWRSNSLNKLQDFTSILLVIQRSLQMGKQKSQFNFQDKDFINFCILQAQEISKYYSHMKQNYFLDYLRDILVQYRENVISYKQLSVSVNHLIEECNLIEEQIYTPILQRMNKGVQLRESNSSNNNIYANIKNYTNSLMTMRMEQLAKLICNHSNRLDNIAYFSLMSFSYLQVIIRIFQKFQSHYTTSMHLYPDRDQKVMKKLNDNLIRQLIKYGEYFQQFCDLQNSQICYSDCLELNPSSPDVFIALIKLFRKFGDYRQQKMSYQLALIQFPQKTVFLSGMLSILNIAGQEQANLIRVYQNLVCNEGQHLLLSTFFKERIGDINSHNLFFDYHQTAQPQEFFSNLRIQLLKKNFNSHHLNPIKKIQDILNCTPKQSQKIITLKKNQNPIQSIQSNNQKQNILSNNLTQSIQNSSNQQQNILPSQPIIIPLNKPMIILTPLEKKTSLNQITVQEIQQIFEKTAQNIAQKTIKKKIIINPNQANKSQKLNDTSSGELRQLSDKHTSLIQRQQIEQQFVKIIQNPSHSKTMEDKQMINRYFLPFNNDYSDIIKETKEIKSQQVKDSSTNCSTTSNHNFSRSSSNCFEILSSSNSLLLSPNFIDPQYNQINY